MHRTASLTVFVHAVLLLPAASSLQQVSLVLEYADWGSLRTALDAGAFFASDNSLNFAAILDTAADIARAMLHLHKNSVLHSDLKVRAASQA